MTIGAPSFELLIAAVCPSGKASNPPLESAAEKRGG